MKIDTCIIVKNEEKTIKKLIEQFLVFSNEVHITDTGSTDSTIKIVEDFQKSYPNVFLHHFEWCMNFSKARNYSLTCYDCKADYQFWCDGDDELNDKLLETLKEFKNSTDKDADIYFMKYKYSANDNNPHYRTSLLKVSAHLIWNDPIHEYIGYTYLNKVNYDLFDNGSLIIHHKNPTVNHSDRNLQIFLQMERDKYKFTARNRFYYARELYYNKLIDTAIYHWHKCIDCEDNNKLDKYNACCKLFEVKDHEAIDYFFKLFKKNLYRKDIFYWAGKYYYENNQHDLARFYYILCINCQPPQPGFSFGYNPICHINSLLQLGVIEFENKNVKKSLEYNKQILDIDPNNKIALDNINLLKKHENNSNKQ